MSITVSKLESLTLVSLYPLPGLKLLWLLLLLLLLLPWLLLLPLLLSLLLWLLHPAQSKPLINHNQCQIKNISFSPNTTNHNFVQDTGDEMSRRNNREKEDWIPVLFIRCPTGLVIALHFNCQNLDNSPKVWAQTWPFFFYKTNFWLESLFKNSVHILLWRDVIKWLLYYSPAAVLEGLRQCTFGQVSPGAYLSRILRHFHWMLSNLTHK